MARARDRRELPHEPQERRSPVNKWAIALAVVVALAFLYAVRLAVLPFLVAAAIAYVADPAVRQIAIRFRLSRGSAAAIVFFAILAALAGFGYWTISLLIGDVLSVLRDAPDLLHKFIVEIFGDEHFGVLGQHYDASQLTQQLFQGLFADLGNPRQWLGMLLLGFGILTGVILVIVLLFYYLSAGPRLAAGVLWLVPPEYRDEVAEVAAKIDPMLRRYLLGLLIIVMIATALAFIAIDFALHLPFAFLLALVTGVLELLPVLGPLVSACLVGLISLEQHGLWAVIAFAVYLTLFRLAIDRLIGPIVLGRAVALHPTVVIFAFLAGGLILGVPGVILAVPVAASVKVVLDHYYSQPMRGHPP